MSRDFPKIFAMNGFCMKDDLEKNFLQYGYNYAKKFEWRRQDGESYSCSSENIRGRDIYVFQSFASDAGESVDEKIWGTLMFVSSLRSASARSVTLIGTMLPYMRQDQKDKPRAPIGTAYFVKQCEAAGVDRIITMDVHNLAAMQNSCDALQMNFDHLEARKALVKLVSRDLVDEVRKGRRVVVLTPDAGATKRTKSFQSTLEESLNYRLRFHDQKPIKVGFAHGDKVRVGDSEIEINTIIENPEYPIEGALVVVPDDILATGSTLCGIEQAITQRGGELYAVCVTHAIGTNKESLEKNLKAIPRIYAANTVNPWRFEGTSVFDRMYYADVSPYFASAIWHTFNDGSINELLTNFEPY